MMVHKRNVDEQIIRIKHTQVQVERCEDVLVRAKRQAVFAAHH